MIHLCIETSQIIIYWYISSNPFTMSIRIAIHSNYQIQFIQKRTTNNIQPNTINASNQKSTKCSKMQYTSYAGCWLQHMRNSMQANMWV